MATKKTPAVKTFKSAAEAKQFAGQKETELKNVAKQSYSKPTTQTTSSQSTPAVSKPTTSSANMSYDPIAQLRQANTSSPMLNTAINQSGLAQTNYQAPQSQGMLSTFKQNIQSGNTALERPIFATGVDEYGNPTTTGSPTIGDIGLASAGVTGGELLGASAAAKLTSKATQSKQKWANLLLRADDIGYQVANGKWQDPSLSAVARGEVPLKQTKNYLNKITGGTNTKTARLAQQGIAKTTSTFSKSPLTLLGLVFGGGYLAYDQANKAISRRSTTLWGIGEAQDMLQFSKDEAIESGDLETAQAAEELYNELSNPELQKSWKLYVPFMSEQIMMNAKTGASNIKGENIAFKAKQKEEDAALAKAGTPRYGTEEWWAAKEERDATAEQEARTYWEDQSLDKETKAQTERDFWTEYQNQEQIRTDEERAYWAAKEERDRQREAEERAYWEEVRKKAENVPSKLNFGILK